MKPGTDVVLKRLAEIEERAEKATEGPWEAWSVRSGGEFPVVQHHRDDKGRRVTCFPAICSGGVLPNEDNAAFIAHARADIPWLLKELKELRGAVLSMPDAG